MNKKSALAPVLLYVLGLSLVFLAGFAFAKTSWEFHKSITNSFDIRFPAEYKIKSMPLRIDPTTVLFRTEIIANVGEGENGKQNMKTFLVKVDQSMGGSLVNSKVRKLLKRDEYKYKQYARKGGGQLESVSDVNISGFLGKEFLITYQDGNKKQGIRAKIMYTDISRVELVLTGPADSMYAFKSNDFFDSVKLYDGPGMISGTIGDGWKEYPSPLGLYSLVTPPENNTYGLGAPKFSHEGAREKGRYVFRDPVTGYKVFYNSYGYKIEAEKTYDDIKTLLYTEHVSRYTSLLRMTDLKLENTKSEDGSYGIVSTRIKMPPLSDYPYITSVSLQAIFNKDGIVVLEVLGASDYLDTPLAKTLFSLVKFHPEKAYHNKEETGAQGEAPSETTDDPFKDEAEEFDEEEVILDDEEDNEGGSGPTEAPEDDKKTDASASSPSGKAVEEDKQKLQAKIVLGAPSPAEEDSGEEASGEVSESAVPTPSTPEAQSLPKTADPAPVKQEEPTASPSPAPDSAAPKPVSP